MSWEAAGLLGLVVVGAVGALRWPLVGLLVYLWLDFMRPQDLWVELRAYRPMMGVAVATIAATAWQLRDRGRRVALLSDLEKSTILSPLGAFLIVVGLSALQGVDPGLSASVWFELAKSVAIAGLIVVLVRDAGEFDAVLWVISYSVAVLALGVVVQGWERGLLDEFRIAAVVEGPAGNADGTFRDNNDLARVLALWLPMAWVLASQQEGVAGRVIGFAMVGALAAGILMTFSRSGFLAAVVGVGILLLCRKPAWPTLAVAGVSLLALIVLAPESWRDRISAIAAPHREASVGGRLEIWQRAVSTVQAHTLLGTGPGTFEDVHARPAPLGRRASHNIYIELATEVGLLGLAVYFSLAVATVRTLVRSLEQDDLRCAGLLAGLAAYWVAGLALSSPFQSPAFVLIGLAIAVPGGRVDRRLP